jgi:hypothetical protein
MTERHFGGSLRYTSLKDIRNTWVEAAKEPWEERKGKRKGRDRAVVYPRQSANG